MSFTMRVRCSAPAMAVLCLGFAPALSASDTDDGNRYAQLSLSPAGIGGSLRVTLRAGIPNQPAVLLADVAVNSVDPDGFGKLPYLRVFSPAMAIAVVPSVGTGVLAFDVPLPMDPLLIDAKFFAQAITVDGGGFLGATAVAATTISPTPATPSLTDASNGIPSIAASVATAGGAARDLDFDGDPDLVLATESGLLVFRNDGALQFSDITASVLPAGFSGLIADIALVELFDADNDKDVDVFVGGGVGNSAAPPQPNVLLLNQWTQGAFQFVVGALPAIAGLPQDIAIADLDRDGDLDVVLANGQDGVHAGESPDPNVLLVNLGGGNFQVEPAFATAAWNGPDHNNGVTVGDIDDDGDLDLLFARADTNATDGVPGQPNVLLRNDGSFSFTDVSAAQLVPWFSDNSRKARFADLDGDSDLDLVVVNSVVSVASANSGEFYLNDGTGTFFEAPALFPQITESEDSVGLQVHVLDADLDGDVDVLFALHEFFDFNGSLGSPTGTGGDDLLFVNGGGAQGGIPGTFTIDPTFTVGAAFISADHIVADFDLDGDDDVYVCANGGLFAPLTQDRLLHNLRIP